MQQSHNIWREVWLIAEPIPSHKQKKLFDDTREAEKVLHYLAGLKTAELALLVLPVLMHCAVQVLQEKHGACVYGCVCVCVCVCLCLCARVLVYMHVLNLSVVTPRTSPSGCSIY